MNRIRVGSQVRHDFSKMEGKVLAIRRDTNRYNYQVEWSGDPIIEWYRRDVLELL